MRACLAVLLLSLLGAFPAFGSPFDPVPQGDPAYGDCRYLAECGIIDARLPDDFAGATPLTRYDFTLSLLRPMAALERLARDGRVGAALDDVRLMPASERTRVATVLARLLQEFGDVLSVLEVDASPAIAAARSLGNGDFGSRANSTEVPGAAGISYTTTRARLGVVYRETEGEAAALPHLPLGGLPDAPITGLARSRLPTGRAEADLAAPERVASTDISLRRLRGTFEYGITDNLTFNLAYESMLREGGDFSALDAASLRTLGLGYRLSPSTSVALKYHLIDYADYSGRGARFEDRMAETDLTIRF